MVYCVDAQLAGPGRGNSLILNNSKLFCSLDSSTETPVGTPSSSKISTTVVVVSVPFVVLVIVLAGVILLYRRRYLRALKSSTNVLAVEMQSQSPSEPLAEPLVEPSQNFQASLCQRNIKLCSNSKKPWPAMGLIYELFYRELFHVKFFNV